MTTFHLNHDIHDGRSCARGNERWDERMSEVGKRGKGRERRVLGQAGRGAGTAACDQFRSV
jgi:hypothetical protein